MNVWPSDDEAIVLSSEFPRQFLNLYQKNVYPIKKSTDIRVCCCVIISLVAVGCFGAVLVVAVDCCGVVLVIVVVCFCCVVLLVVPAVVVGTVSVDGAVVVDELFYLNEIDLSFKNAKIV